jgi:hypothetical protein
MALLCPVVSKHMSAVISLERSERSFDKTGILETEVHQPLPVYFMELFPITYLVYQAGTSLGTMLIHLDTNALAPYQS